MNAQVGPTQSSRVKRLRVHAVLWNTFRQGSVAYALTNIIDNLPEGVVDATLWGLGGSPLSPRTHFKRALPRLLYRAFCKMDVPADLQGKVASMRVLRAVKPGDVLYVWPPYDLSLIRRAQCRGAIVVAERTNCMGSMGRERLTRAYARRGLPLPQGWFPERDRRSELEQMMQCDYVTAANGLVAQSLRDAGIAETKILETFYGFDPVRLAGAIGVQRPDRPPVFAFVGSGIVRKGLDVLLEAWDAANVQGKLLIAGHVDDEMSSAYAGILARHDVEVLGHVADIAGVYAAADVFVFPTHEEGGPQVVYEAAGCGLPSIVSSMGAGRIVRDGLEGLLIDPLDVEALAGAIGKMAKDKAMRRRMGAATAERAREFTWAKVGEHYCAHFSRISQAAGLGSQPSSELV